MKNASTDGWLSNAIGKAQRSAKFCASGSFPGVDPGIHIDGIGAIKLPVKPAAAKALIARCRVAPYGKGTETLINRNVRNTLELDPADFRLGDTWNDAIAGALPDIAEQLGLPADGLEARLYKLLVYEKGGFFLPHRDSEKHDRMVASLIVVLPNPFGGGTLTVRHGTARRTFAFAEAAAGTAPCYAAFYADCEHEVARVTRGRRLCLAYNLVLKPQHAGPSRAAGSAGPGDQLAESIRSWMAARPGAPLVFALEHHYTQHGLSLDLLKGADRDLADEVVPAAQDSDGLVYLAQVERHLVQDAHDDDYRAYGRHGHRYWDPDDDEDASSDEIEIGETIEDDFYGSEWTDLAGEKQPFGHIPFETESVVSEKPLEEWTPTREHYEGYTGNAGNTLDRWYHRSALVVWHVDHHFDVILSAGAAQGVGLFASMTAQLARTPKTQIGNARRDCRRLARAIIDRWPQRYANLYRDTSKSECDRFPEYLLRLHDRDTVTRFLAKLAGHDQSLRLKTFIPAACHEFGYKAFAAELRKLLTVKPERWHDSGLATRDLEWLAAVCADDSHDGDRASLAGELCNLAVKRFCEAPVERTYHEASSKARALSLELLLQAITAGGSEAALSRAVAFVLESQKGFDLDHCQVPCLERLVPWCCKQLGSVPSPIVSWWSALRKQLESATRSHPEPYSDWKRPDEVECKCRFCAQLKSFLADPNQETTRISAAEHDRSHLGHKISQHLCDVKTKLERVGRPYTLVLTKTDASFGRAVQRFAADQKLLKRLVNLGKDIGPRR